MCRVSFRDRGRDKIAIVDPLQERFERARASEQYSLVISTEMTLIRPFPVRPRVILGASAIVAIALIALGAPSYALLLPIAGALAAFIVLLAFAAPANELVAVVGKRVTTERVGATGRLGSTGVLFHHLYTTLQNQAGQQTEYECDYEMDTLLVKDHIGVVSIRNGQVIAFVDLDEPHASSTGTPLGRSH